MRPSELGMFHVVLQHAVGADSQHCPEGSVDLRLTYIVTDKVPEQPIYIACCLARLHQLANTLPAGDSLRRIGEAVESLLADLLGWRLQTLRFIERHALEALHLPHRVGRQGAGGSP